MKKYIITALLAVAATCMNGQTAGPVPAAGAEAQIEFLQKQYEELNKQKADLKELNTQIAGLKKDFGKELGSKASSAAVDSLRERMSLLSENIRKVADDLGVKIDSTGAELQSNRESVEKTFSNVWLVVIIVLLACIAAAALVYILLRRRIGQGSQAIEAVRNANSKLSEQAVSLDTRMAEILERQLHTDEAVSRLSGAGKNVSDETDHSLILNIANELARINQNLAFMDPKVKGVSQLRNRAASITRSLADKGYEVPDLVGTEYREGHNYEVVMEEDEDMEPGKMIVRRVTRPCVLYKGKMIQAPSVVVAYNPEG